MTNCRSFSYSASEIHEARVQLTAIFETWHFGDGNYPPLAKDQLVKLSFEVEPDVLSKCAAAKNGKFEQIKDAEYKFEGIVLKIYGNLPDCPIVIVQAGNLKFYINSLSKGMPALEEGDGCRGSGRLLLDHYIWVEFRHEYQESPDLLYPLRVSKIRWVKIPDELISRSTGGASGPTSLRGEQYSQAAAVEITQMVEGSDADWSFYLVDFDDLDIGTAPIPLTFHG